MPRTAITNRSTTNIARRKPVIGNMLYNGDFEILPTTNTAMTSSASAFIDGTAAGSSTNATYGWFVYNYNGTRSAIFDTTTKYAGNGSLKLTTDSGSIGVALHANVDNDASWSRNNFPCEPNTTYNLSVWIKTNLISGSATTGAAVIIAERNKTNATVSGGGRTIVSGIVTTTDWTQYTATITTLASTRFLNPQFQLIGNNGSATLNMEAWFDNLTISQSYPRKDVGNLLSNGNFEYIPPFTAATTTGTRWIDGTATGSGNSDSPYKWFVLSSSINNFSAQFDTSIYRSGTTSLKTSTLDATGVVNIGLGNNNNRQTIERTTISALPNTSYTITAWIKTNNVATNGAFIDIVEYSGSASQQATSTTSKLSGTNDWTQVTKTFTTGSNTRYILVVLRNNVAGNVSDVWFDDITLTTTAPYRNRKSIDNLVENGDFESAPTFVAATTASGWIIGTAAASTTSNAYKWRLAIGAGTVSAQYDNTVYKNGTSSMKVSTGVGGYGEVVNATAKDTAIPILPSTSYTITAWMKTELISGSATSGARIVAAEYSGDFVGGTTKATTSILTTTDWTQYSITWTTASTARYLVVGGNVRGNNGAADLSMNAWYDDITLVKN
jgi:hypothetical protein